MLKEAACTLNYNGRHRRRFKRCMNNFRYVRIFRQNVIGARYSQKLNSVREKNYYRID